MNEQPAPVTPSPQPSSPLPPTPIAAAPQPVPPEPDFPSSPEPQFEPPAPETPPSPEPYSTRAPEPTNLLQWQASEYIMREKNNLWFVGLAVVSLVLIVVAIFLLNNWLFAVLVFVMAVSVVIFARRPARDLQYRLSSELLAVNDKTFPLSSFRAFGIMPEGGLYSITLLPVKRFSPGVSIFFPPENGEAIVDMLGSRLPMEQLEPDFIDRLSEKLHF